MPPPQTIAGKSKEDRLKALDQQWTNAETTARDPITMLSLIGSLLFPERKIAQAGIQGLAGLGGGLLKGESLGQAAMSGMTSAGLAGAAEAVRGRQLGLLGEHEMAGGTVPQVLKGGAVSSPPASRPTTPTDRLPYTFQRYDEIGDVATVDKPHGLFTTPANVASPHSDIGPNKTMWMRSPNAKVLDLTDSPPTPIRRGAIDSGTGIHALRRLVGEQEFARLRNLSDSELDALLVERGGQYKHPYFDTQDKLEALGGIAAKQAGYDAVYRAEPADPRFTEYVGMTSKGLSPAPTAAASGAPDLVRQRILDMLGQK